MLKIDQLSWINNITKQFNMKYSQLPKVSPKRWADGLIFYNDIDLSKLVINSETSIKNLYTKKYLLTHHKGFIEYKNLYTIKEYQDINIFNTKDLYELIDIINFLVNY